MRRSMRGRGWGGGDREEERISLEMMFFGVVDRNSEEKVRLWECVFLESLLRVYCGLWDAQLVEEQIDGL